MADWPSKRAAAFTVTFPIYDNDGDLVSAAAALDSEVDIDAAGFNDATAEATEVGTSGIYKLALTAAEMTGGIISTITKTTTTNAKTAVNVMYTATRQLIDLAFPVISGNGIDVVGGGVEVGTFQAGAITAAAFTAGAIDAAAIANGAIDAATFAAGAIDAAAIATAAIDADAIATDAIGAAELAADAVNEIADGIFTRASSNWEASAPVKSLGTAVMKAVHRIRDNAGTLEIYRSNGTTIHASQTITVDAALDPIDELTGAV